MFIFVTLFTMMSIGMSQLLSSHCTILVIILLCADPTDPFPGWMVCVSFEPVFSFTCFNITTRLGRRSSSCLVFAAALLYNITSPQGPRVHLPVTYFLFRDTTFHLVLALSASLRPKYGTPYLFTSANLKLPLPSDVILRRTT